jgi:RNA polymerase sigma factor (sigma-70 family)
MTSVQAGLVLQHVRRHCGTAHPAGPPDAQLLERFVRQHDEAAFSALLQRHGPMVLNVCRAVLRHEQDAEDAFQATFLVLARKADTIARPEAVAGWLHEVAHRAAVKAQADAARRRTQERKAAPMNVADPTLDMTLRDLCGVLHEELRRLPERYRLPLVLCYLEGLSHEEAAAGLGWSKGAFRGRLDRGRERLRRRLAARGVALSALLGAVAPRAEALVVSTGFSARATAVAEGVIRAMFTNKCKVVAGVLLAAALAAAAGVLAHQALASGEPPAERPKPKEKARAAVAEGKGDTVLVTGRVVDPAGKPVAGAKVYYSRSTLLLRDPPPPPPAPATADARGQFRFRISRTGYLAEYEKAYWLQGAVIGVSPGYGPAWVGRDNAEKLSDVTLKLVKDVPIEGRVLDLEGKPIAGVSVRVRGFHLREDDKMNAWLENLQAGKEIHGPHFSLSWLDPAHLGLARPVLTGGNGKFRLTGVGANRVVTLRFEGPTIATGEVYVITRPFPRIVVPRQKNRPDLGNYVYHGPTFDYVAAPTVPLAGTVRASDTGKPLAGVTIQTRLYAAYGYVDRDHYVRTTTDSQGRYRLVGLPKAGHYLAALAASGQPYLPSGKTTAAGFGLDAVTVPFELKRGVVIRGRVTSRQTQQPVPAEVEYLAFADNPHLEGSGVRGFTPIRTRTAADGSFTLVGLPGRGLLAVKALYGDKDRYVLAAGAERIKGLEKGSFRTHMGPVFARAYNTLVEVNPGREVRSIRQDVALEPGKKEGGGVRSKGPG